MLLWWWRDYNLWYVFFVNLLANIIFRHQICCWNLWQIWSIIIVCLINMCFINYPYWLSIFLYSIYCNLCSCRQLRFVSAEILTPSFREIGHLPLILVLKLKYSRSWMYNKHGVLVFSNLKFDTCSLWPFMTIRTYPLAWNSSQLFDTRHLRKGIFESHVIVRSWVDSANRVCSVGNMQ